MVWEDGGCEAPSYPIPGAARYGSARGSTGPDFLPGPIPCTTESRLKIIPLFFLAAAREMAYMSIYVPIG